MRTGGNNSKPRKVILWWLRASLRLKSGMSMGIEFFPSTKRSVSATHQIKTGIGRKWNMYIYI